MTDVDDQAVYRRAVTLFEAPVADELVALDQERGLCFGFNESATTIWSALDAPRRFAELEGILVSTFDVDAATCREALVDLLEALEREGLVERVG